jgi:serine protease Do
MNQTFVMHCVTMTRVYLLATLSLLLCVPAAIPGAEAVSLRQSALVKAVAAARPSIVNIHGQKTIAADAGPGQSDEQGQRVKGMGTGVVVDHRGYILTNFHVVEGVRRINVNLADGTATVGRLVAHDPITDLAIIKIDVDRKLPLIRFGSSDDLMTGEEVIAVGNAYGYEHTVTRGIISALHRTVQVNDTQKYYDLIQTDASINPGNSGGPLLNIDGEMIGLNVAVRVGAQGIGFAIPVDRAIEVATQLLAAQRISGVWHGVVADMADESKRQGITTLLVEAGSPAEASGIQKGDIVTRANGITVRRALDFERALIGTRPGQSVPISVTRNGQTLDVTLQLASAHQRKESGNPESIEEIAWSKLGLRLVELTRDEIARYRRIVTSQAGSDYKLDGGLRVASIRANSPASQQGIRPGDVLVGLHKWKTMSFDNVAYILREPELAQQATVTFYIVRGGDTLYGQLPVTWLSR